MSRFSLDQMQAIMDRINNKANAGGFEVPIAVTQIQFRDNELWIQFTRDGVKGYEATVSVDSDATIDDKLIDQLGTGLIHKIMNTPEVETVGEAVDEPELA